jgi:hypothetical protein
VQRPAQRNQYVDIRVRRQRRCLAPSMKHPPEDVRIAAQFLERIYPRVCGTEISEEATNSSTVVTNGFGIKGSA